MIISFIYFIKSLSSLQNEIYSLKSSCSKCFINTNNTNTNNTNTNTNTNNTNTNNTEDILKTMKEIFMNYIRK